VFLDARGFISDLNRGAKTLLGRPLLDSSETRERREAEPHAGGKFAALFCAREQARIEAWLQRALAVTPAPGAERREDPPEAELINGLRVRIRTVAAAMDDRTMILLEAASTSDAGKQREERAEAELRNALEWVEEGVVLFDADQNIRVMNTRFAQIAGLAPGEVEQCASLEELLSLLSDRAADPERFAERWRVLARGIEGGVREELQLARPVPRVLERAARPVLGNKGRRLGRVEIYRDLTAQRVFQSRLLQTEKLAALGQMVTGVAHELSNPLTSILGYAQRLLLRNDFTGRSEEARQIYQEAERASTILRQILLSAREARPERKRVALNQIVLRALELQRFGLAAEKIRVEMDLDPVLPFVAGDPGQLQQVLMNLIGNARQAIEEHGDGGTIRLRTARTDAGRISLEVSDDGPGIPDAILARIFDPFFTTKPAGIGTGLGLAIVLSVVREHGGRVSVLNRPEGGAVFSIELPTVAAETVEIGRGSAATRERILPLEDSRAAAASEGLLTPASPGVSLQDRSGTRVLVVEDEPTVARLIADVLEDEKMNVDVLLDGREALARAERERYDLVICDMKMPGIDGQHFFKSLERTHNPLRERFLFVTGDVIAAHTQDFLERNNLPHVAKPFRMEELTEKVHRVLDRDSTAGQRAAAAKKTQ
jgi:two-component system NtrC family sensor kinase